MKLLLSFAILVLFCALSCWQIFGRFIYKSILMRATQYCITSKRIIIIQKENFMHLSFADIRYCSKTRKRCGMGNIFFSKPLEGNPFSFSLAILKEAMGFYGLKKNRIAFERAFKTLTRFINKFFL